jgi:hypothetical protein
MTPGTKIFESSQSLSWSRNFRNFNEPKVSHEPLDHVLIQMQPKPSLVSFRSVLILSYNLCLGLDKCSRPSGFPVWYISNHISKEESASLEDFSCSATRKIARFLCNPKVHRRVHKGPQLVPIRSHMNGNPHTATMFSLRPILILSSHLHMGHPSELFLRVFPF